MAMDLKKRREEEYEMQLFGFNSRAVNVTLERTIREKIDMCCKKLNDSLRRMYKSEENIALNVENHVKSLMMAYHTHSQTHTNIMKRGIQRLIAIPDNVLLDEDTCQENQYSIEEYRNIEDHLKRLRSRAKQAIVLQTAFAKELQMIETFGLYETSVEMLFTLIENSPIQHGGNNNIIQCIENCRGVENIVKTTCLSPYSNLYVRNLENVCIKALDLNIY